PPVAGLDPAKAPAANFDLSLWKITLPVDSSGGFSGSAIEVKSIGAAYQKAPYFHTGADGGMVFMAPVEGATTSGSKYPRSELREMTASGGLAAWTAAQGGSLSATLAVNEVPMTSAGARGRVVIGQIHGPDDELCRLYYDNGRLYFYDDKAGSGLKETQFILKSNSGAETNIPLNAKFDYSILVTPTMMTVSAVHSGVVYSASEMLSSFWPGKSLYYKAGVYVQVGKAGSGAGTTGSGKGQTTFYRLTRPSHN
ncbi:MAG TPA: polysaccharide lyase family 7 protein, partial [Bdellovibrionales bacterium]|nr:polysaccharide lyase family 7 protein [Bdellovibrionales bacterium]